MRENEKRLFFAYEVTAPWPLHYPKANLLDNSSRHLTLAFLGNIPYLPLQNILNEFPSPPFKVGFTGIFDSFLFLPEKNPHVVSYHLQNYEDLDDLLLFQKEIYNWLTSHNYVLDSRPFLPHVTIGRNPLDLKEWVQTFTPLPFLINNIHLYESLGNLIYKPIWSYPLIPPFEEIDHTADIAFVIQAESISSLHLHAQMALAFKHPLLVKYIPDIPLKNSLDDIIMALNQLISQADCDTGCPLKAVSFHGNLSEKNGIFKWEMIVDV